MLEDASEADSVMVRKQIDNKLFDRKMILGWGPSQTGEEGG